MLYYGIAGTRPINYLKYIYPINLSLLSILKLFADQLCLLCICLCYLITKQSSASRCSANYDYSVFPVMWKNN